jgi:hypothetical protein
VSLKINIMHTDYERYRKMASLAQVGWWEADLTGGYYLCSDFLCDLLVLDGSTGQNAFEQAKQFTAATEVTCLAVTKLDGTAKGGVVIGISDQFQIPVKYIGVGEGINDLQVFNKFEFVDSFFN